MTQRPWSHSAVKRAARLLLTVQGIRPVVGRSTAIDAQKPFMQYDFSQNRMVYAQPYGLDDLYVRVIEYLIRVGEYDAVDGGIDDFQFSRPTVLVLNPHLDDQRVMAGTVGVING